FRTRLALFVHIMLGNEALGVQESPETRIIEKVQARRVAEGPQGRDDSHGKSEQVTDVGHEAHRAGEWHEFPGWLAVTQRPANIEEDKANSVWSRHAVNYKLGMAWRRERDRCRGRTRDEEVRFSSLMQSIQRHYASTRVLDVFLFVLLPPAIESRSNNWTTSWAASVQRPIQWAMPRRSRIYDSRSLPQTFR